MRQLSSLDGPVSPWASQALISWVGVATLALLHFWAGRVLPRFVYRQTWLSAAAGISVAYALVHLLPDLAEEQARWIETLPHRPLRWLTDQVY